jgi:peptidoglycan/LPS O-acetylase OafA/YrhL
MSNASVLNLLVSGAITMGYVVAALFFLRFWRQSRDRLFLLFSAAFLVLAGQRLALALTTQNNESPLFLYVVRLFAFLLILVAIIDKNRAKPQ